MYKRLGNIKVTTSTRFWFAVLAFIVNTIVFIFGISKGIDPTALGTGLALMNTPVYGYIFGRTVRGQTTEKTDTADN